MADILNSENIDIVCTVVEKLPTWINFLTRPELFLNKLSFKLELKRRMPLAYILYTIVWSIRNKKAKWMCICVPINAVLYIYVYMDTYILTQF